VKSDGFAQLNEQSFIRDFAGDLEPMRARTLYAVQGRISVTLFGSRTSRAAWKSKPNWYAVSTQDRTTSPQLERLLANRMKAKTIEVNSSHVSLLSHPQEIADLILTAAGSTDAGVRTDVNPNARGSHALNVISVPGSGRA
jgi:pimeloyl-ACP methyl ester carboxylesterase